MKGLNIFSILSKIYIDKLIDGSINQSFKALSGNLTSVLKLRSLFETEGWASCRTLLNLILANTIISTMIINKAIPKQMKEINELSEYLHYPLSVREYPLYTLHY